MARLRRVDCSTPGIERRRRGTGFEYFDQHGKKVDDPEVLDRIDELVIPPAWEDVWICPYPMGHIQATGIDARSRKQYLYHGKWRERRDQEKFDEMVRFARCLPKLRTTVRRDLNRKELDQQRVLACAVRMLDRGFFRIGGEDYAESNDSYGLATMRKDHVELGEDNRIEFDFPAKSGKRHERTVVDPEVFEVVQALKRRRGGGDDLLAYKAGGRWTNLRSEDINGYIKAIAGDDFSAKAFRTWNATVLAAIALAVSGPAALGSKTAKKRAVTRAVKEVAHYLGNTPTVARASYIDPRIFDRFDSGITIAGDDFSAKAFRTWNATVLAAIALAVSGPAALGSKTAKKRAVTRAVKEVAHYLGNTPTVARASYIDPRIFDRFDSGITIAGVLQELGGQPDLASIHGRVEHAVLDLIAEDEESPHIEQVEELEELAA